jgi:GNAT superfamily N-acetyltransferase
VTCDPSRVTDPWAVFADIEFAFRTAARPDGALRGDGWFAAVTGQDHSGLNICGLRPDATPESAAALVSVLGQIPAVVFTSEHVSAEARDVLLAEDFAVAGLPEPLMWCAACPAPVAGPFRVEPAAAEQVGPAIRLIAEAHRIDQAMLDATIGAAAADGIAEPWIAWDDADPVSTVWLVMAGGVVGVNEMMTPPRHQRRGAGRQLLSTALAARWTPATTGAVLLSTVAGRRLYESVGFTVIDEVITCHRGVDDDLLEAIGQTLGR